ncbi:ArsR/SmtB family transcription factor [Streptomyces sp. NPDC006285]|uniref:ArsR/SmtB family transcription factor n=1 Tax=Streptomyces sp. NPDC006285 TaxID=3364742 RepID=UPI0036855158
MGWWQVSADTLAGSRFVLSPLAETFACLKTLHTGTAAHPGERAWLRTHLPPYRRLLASDPVTAALVRAGLGVEWIADFLTPAPRGEEDFATEVARVRDASPEAAPAHLTTALRGPLPAILRDRDDLPERAADLLTHVWTETVRPDWPRRRQVLEADVVARTSRLSQEGWAAALGSLRPGMRWLGENRLQVNLHEYPPREISGAGIVFVPVTPQRRGWVSWEEPDRYAVVYPCSGVLAHAEQRAEPQTGGRNRSRNGAPNSSRDGLRDGSRDGSLSPYSDVGAGTGSFVSGAGSAAAAPASASAGAPASLVRLLGGGRAGVLALLDSPMSTSQLVAVTGQGLGSVGRHLKVLLDARLVWRRRSGRSVLYYRTAAGEVLVRAQGAAPSQAERS